MLRTRLQRGERGLDGLFIGGVTPEFVEMAALMGFDYVVLDAEHGAVSGALADLIRVARLSGIASLVRIPRHSTETMAQALDYGANGVLVPGVRDADEIRAVVHATRYPPEGTRGVAFSIAAAGYGLRGRDYVSQARSSTIVVIQVETSEALEAIDAWADIDGVHAFFVGPADLSMALGEEGRPGPRFEQAMNAIVSALETKGRPWGIFAATAEARRHWKAVGAALLATGVPTVFAAGLAQWREDDANA